jgi:TetR/AcrR family transcriptional repressor of nem operon
LAIGSAERRPAKSGGPPVSFAKLIDDYLSDAHRKNPGTGCAFSALAPEIARSQPKCSCRLRDYLSSDGYTDLALCG